MTLSLVISGFATDAQGLSIQSHQSMMNIPNFYLEPATYEVDFEEIRSVRNSVFVIEQQIPQELEFVELVV